MWVTINGKIIGMLNDVPGKIMEPVCLGIYKHDDLAPDEREILAEAARVPEDDANQISRGAWLSYLRFEVIDGNHGTVVEFDQLKNAESHFKEETRNGYRNYGRCAQIKLVAVIRTGIAAGAADVPEVDENEACAALGLIITGSKSSMIKRTRSSIFRDWRMPRSTFTRRARRPRNWARVACRSSWLLSSAWAIRAR